MPLQAGFPAAFVGAPVKSGNKTIGVIALQLPLKAINAIMQERSGMGKTGESYLIGSNKLMRSEFVPRSEKSHGRCIF